MLTVGLDVSSLALTRAGTARYLVSLAAALERAGEVALRRYDFGGAGRLTAAVRDAAWYPWVLPLLAARDRVDVLHCPTQRAPVRPPVPLVVTLHDVAVLRHPYLFNRWSRTYSARTLPGIVRTAAAVVVVSEFTRDEARSLLPLSADRVHVVPHGVGPPFAPDGPAAAGDYVLAVSTREPRKNLERVIAGFVEARLPGCELRIAGAAGWGDVRAAGRGVKLLGEVGDEELAALYRGARCVVYCSLYEGFGLPVLEAMACGAPVVTSAAPALLEVGSDAVVAVDAVDPAAIARGLVEAIDRRAELGRRGSARAAAFDWARAARETAAVYRAVAA